MPRLASLRSAWRRLFTERLALAVATRVVTLLDGRLQSSLNVLERQLSEVMEPQAGSMASWSRRSSRCDRLAAAAPTRAGQARMVGEAPSGQAVVDLFAGEWSSGLPAASGLVSGGQAGLFDDAHIAWFDRHLGADPTFVLAAAR